MKLAAFMMISACSARRIGGIGVATTCSSATKRKSGRPPIHSGGPADAAAFMSHIISYGNKEWKWGTPDTSRSGRRTLILSGRPASISLGPSSSSSSLKAREETNVSVPAARRLHTSPFLDQVEQTIQRVFRKHGIQTTTVTSSPPPSSQLIDDSGNDNGNDNHQHNVHVNPLPQHRLKLDPAIVKSINPPSEREALGVAIHLHNRISHSLTKNGDCRRCWLQQAHCICSRTPSLESMEGGKGINTVSCGYSSNRNSNGAERIMTTKTPRSIKRLFILMHHKEIGMAVDTSKLLLSSFPKSCRLVINGIDPGLYDVDIHNNSSNYQNSMEEFNDALQQKERKCMVLFPSEDAQTYSDLKKKMVMREEMNEAVKISHCSNYGIDDNDNDDKKWDVIVIDGTWAQARKMYSRYIPKEEDGGPLRVCLSKEAVLGLNASSNLTVMNSNDCCDQKDGGGRIIATNHSGRQLRRHPIKWREVSTLEATRLLIRDVMIEEVNEDQRLMDYPSNEESKEVQVDEPPKCYDTLAQFQQISDEAAKVQLGAPRLKEKHTSV